jgi:hypothetical protein
MRRDFFIFGEHEKSSSFIPVPNPFQRILQNSGIQRTIYFIANTRNHSCLQQSLEGGD